MPHPPARPPPARHCWQLGRLLSFPNRAFRPLSLILIGIFILSLLSLLTASHCASKRCGCVVSSANHP